MTTSHFLYTNTLTKQIKMQNQPTVIYTTISSYWDSCLNINDVICTTYDEQTAIRQTVLQINQDYENIITEEDLQNMKSYMDFNRFIVRKLPKGNACVIHRSRIM